MRRTLLVALMLFTSSAFCFQPRTGHWNNLAESGRGFNIDIQDGVMVLTVYSYDASGNAQWYIASGSMTNGQRNFTGTLDKFVNGQCVACNYSAPVANGNDGTVSVVFTSETSATVTLPGGHTSTIHPFNFKFGDAPQGLLGQWVFVFDIISTFADRYDFTIIAPGGTADSSGQLALDLDRLAGCELEVRGTFAGSVFCADTNATGTLENGFVFDFGLDETFSGLWIAPTSGNQYPMKGFKVKSPGGFTKVASQEGSNEAKAAQSAMAVGERASPELLRVLNELAARIR